LFIEGQTGGRILTVNATVEAMEYAFGPGAVIAGRHLKHDATALIARFAVRAAAIRRPVKIACRIENQGTSGFISVLTVIVRERVQYLEVTSRRSVADEG
jgi:hypothetical protein